MSFNSLTNHLPKIGLGTALIPNNQFGLNSILGSIEIGYRFFDTASSYKNEEILGSAIRKSGINRSNFFIASKLLNTKQTYKGVYCSFYSSLEKLQTDYIDIYLIHKPLGNMTYSNSEVWQAFEELSERGYIKMIGVCNFNAKSLNDIISTSKIPPAINQIELNLLNKKKNTIDFCAKNKIKIIAHTPLAHGKILALKNMKKIADSYGITVSQLCLIWCIQNGSTPIPKSINKERQLENFQSIELSKKIKINNI